MLPTHIIYYMICCGECLIKVAWLIDLIFDKLIQLIWRTCNQLKSPILSSTLTINKFFGMSHKKYISRHRSLKSFIYIYIYIYIVTYNILYKQLLERRSAPCLYKFYMPNNSRWVWFSFLKCALWKNGGFK